MIGATFFLETMNRFNTLILYLHENPKTEVNFDKIKLQDFQKSAQQNAERINQILDLY